MASIIDHHDRYDRITRHFFHTPKSTIFGENVRSKIQSTALTILVIPLIICKYGINLRLPYLQISSGITNIITAIDLNAQSYVFSKNC